MRSLEVQDIVDSYQNEISNWDFYSDSQRAFIKDGYIIVCLRDYNWYKTKERITDALTAIKAIFEIDWIAEMGEGFDYLQFSKYWKKY